MRDKSSDPEDPDGPSVWQRVHRSAARSAAVRVWRRGSDLELMHRSMGLAALGFLTLVPLLVVVAAVDPAQGQGFAEWLGRGLGVSMSSQQEVEDLFASPRKALEATTAYGLAALAVFGLTFGAALQTGYEKVWELAAARWHTMWRHAVWLAALIGYLFAAAQITQDRATGNMAFVTSLWHFATAVLSAVVFFWWSQRLLLGGRVGWRALLPGAVTTAIGLVGLRAFSQLVFSPLIASNAVAYGPYGTVLVVQSWLVGVSVVVYGGAVIGRLLHEEHPHLAHLPPRRRNDG